MMLDQRRNMKNTKGITRCILAMLLCAQGVSAGCPPEDVQNLTTCSFRYRCHQTLEHARLPDLCQASNNFPVSVDLYLTDAVERLDLNHEAKEFIKNVVSLRVTIDRPYTDLAFLQHMTSLENFNMVNSNVDTINGSPFYEHTLLQHIDLSYNKLSDVEELFLFEDTNKLKTLSLAHNNIKEIGGDAFSELNSLVELDLSYNQLTDLTEEPFYNLTKLRTLRLNNNEIVNLNGAVNNLTNLQHLFIGGNNLENIDEESLVIIYHLETFDVSDNHLYYLKPDVFLRHWSHLDGRSICKIILADNHITHLPNASSDVSFGPSEFQLNSRFARHSPNKHNVQLVTNLDLSKNDISHIEYNAFHTIVYLTSLDLSHNKLIDFQVNHDDIMYVKFLNLSNNYLTTLLYDNFAPMTQLVFLELSHNKIESIPDETFKHNIKLKTVNLAFNQISELRNLRLNIFHSNGGYLDLSENNLQKINIPSDEALQLTMLSLHSNKITDAADVNLYNTALKRLIMSNNEIRRLDATSMRLPVTLTHLDLSFNKIFYIEPSTFVRLAHLVYLNLAHNDLNIFDSGVFHGLRQLKTLDLTHNLIHNLVSKSLNDMRALEILILSNNSMQYLNYDGWINHKVDLKVYIEGNNFTCDWVSTALREFYTGFSKMIPRVQTVTTSGDTFEGIPCAKSKDTEELREYTEELREDNRLLLTAQKILEAVKEQTSYLKNYLWYNNSQRPKQNAK